MALLARHFGASPEAVRVQLDRMGLLDDRLRDAPLPTGRRWAHQYGWGLQYDACQAAAAQPRAPRRILDRAMAAYREGRLGVAALAKLDGRSVPDLEKALAEAGVTVKRAIRRVDVSALVAQSPRAGGHRGRISLMTDEGGDAQPHRAISVAVLRLRGDLYYWVFWRGRSPLMGRQRHRRR